MRAENPWRNRPFCDVTLRQIVHISLGGKQARVRLTNEFGDRPLAIGAARIALSIGGGAIDIRTDRELLFDGQRNVVIPAGAIMMSDPVDLELPPLSNIAVSLFIPVQYIRDVTLHEDADQTSYEASGNVINSAFLKGAQELASWYFFDGIDVLSSDQARAIVAVGDSITDGAFSTVNGNHRWPDYLASRLDAAKGPVSISVLNEGIGGNRVLNDSYGPDALSRFNRDVLSQSGVGYLVILEGINDIGRLADLQDPADNIKAQELETAIKQMAKRGHDHGIKVFGATLTPYGGASYYSTNGEAIREALNAWIRTTRELDGVIDFDRATRDPQHPDRLLPQYDSGDHLHPNDSGYEAMGNAVDLSLFKMTK